jgi:hypothetical protein
MELIVGLGACFVVLVLTLASIKLILKTIEFTWNNAVWLLLLIFIFMLALL